MSEKDLHWLIDFNKDSEGNIIIPAKVVEELLEEVEYLGIIVSQNQEIECYIPRYCSAYVANLIQKKRAEQNRRLRLAALEELVSFSQEMGLYNNKD